MSFYIGLAIATKASSLLYLMIPGFVVLVRGLARMKSDMDKLLCQTKVDLQQKTSKYSSSEVEKETCSEVVLDSTAKESEGVPSNDNNPSAWYVFGNFVFQLCTTTFRHGTFALVSLVVVLFISGFVSFVFSPHNILSLRELLGSMHYETDVGLGTYIAFYTRQFLVEQPVQFQIQHIFPYSLGIGVFVFSVLGLLFLPRTKTYNVLRFAILAFFFLTAPWYAKWTRFIGPLYPLMIVCAILFSYQLYKGVRKKDTVSDMAKMDSHTVANCMHHSRHRFRVSLCLA